MHRSSALLRAGAALCSGVLFAIAQPGFGAWPLALVCFVPLIWAWRGESLRMRMVLAWLAGTAGTTLCTVSAGTSGATTYFGLPGVASVFVALAVGQLFGGLSFVGLAAVAGDPLGRGSTLAGLRFAAAVGGMELLRGTLLTGFPWLLLAYSLLPVPVLAGTAAYVGAAGVSMLLAWINVALAAVVASPGERTRAGIVAIGAGLLLAAPAGLGGAGVAGTVLAAERDVPAPGSHRVLLVQPGTLAEGMRGPVATAVALVRQTAEAPAFDLVVWPENAVSAVLPTNVHLVRTALAKRSGAHLILGAPRFEPDERGLRISALLIDASGRTLAYHDKNHLLPFAEYAPGPLPMRWFGSMEVQPGETPGALPVQGTLFGPLICYEVLFAPLARAQVRAGATVLLNLSNDAWFGDTGAAEQHLAAAMYRALESGRPLLRATHTGLTAAIDANGRVVARLPMHEPGTLLVDVVPRSRPTPMLYWGEGPVWLAFGLAVALPAVRRLGRLRTAEEHASVEV